MLKRYLIAACTTILACGFLSPAVSVLASPSQTARAVPLHYDNYPARPIYKGKPAPLVVDSPQVRDFENELQESLAKGTNFAGHYAIADGLNRAMGGQGSAVIVDLKTGKVYLPAQLTGYHDQRGAGYTPPRPDGGLHYRANSKLLEIIGLAGGNDGNQGVGHYYYKWENNQLKFLAFVPSPYESK